MLGLVDAVEDLVAHGYLVTPGRATATDRPRAPRPSSAQIHADRQRRRAALQSAPPPGRPRAPGASERRSIAERPTALAERPGPAGERRPWGAVWVALSAPALIAAWLLSPLLGGPGSATPGSAGRASAPRAAAPTAPPPGATTPAAWPDASPDVVVPTPPTVPARLAPGLTPAAAEGIGAAQPPDELRGWEVGAPATLADVAGLLEVLGDPRAEPRARAAAAAALGSSAAPELEAALCDAALGPDPVARLLALEQLARRGTLGIPARIAVERALDDRDALVRVAAVRAMVAVPGAASRLFPRLAAERDPLVVRACFEALGRTAGPEHLRTLAAWARQSPAAARALDEACRRLDLPAPR